MRCRYKFDVTGSIRILRALPIRFRSFTFEYITSDNTLLKQIWVTFREEDQANWPTVIPKESGPIKAHFRITQPRYDEISNIIMFVEGMLSFFGLDSVNIEESEIEWLPESEQEKSALGVYSFRMSKQSIETNELPEMKLQLLAQSLYAYEDAWHLEPQLNFVRRGMVSIRKEQFIDAIYNFYFYLESRFGNGYTSNKKVEEEFCKNNELRDAILKSRDEFNLTHHQNRRQIYLRFDKYYKGKAAEEIINTLIDLRGFLHHHNQKRKDIWHPSDKWTYCGDAFFLQAVVHKLAFSEALKYIFSEKNEKHFYSEFMHQND